MPCKGAVISAVRPGSIADELGISPGDILVAINGEPVQDLIVYHYLSADENLELKIVKPEGEPWLLEIEKDYGEDLGLKFSAPTFDGMRRCANKCTFCFVDQMPPGLRPGLYIKDDDYRYSFLHGNFITLTNLKQADVEYIYRWHLSPLYISVHTTNPDLRHKLLGNCAGRNIMGQLAGFAEAGIQMHTQIVLCPGFNDGLELERTITDLSSFFPAVQSIGVVPVGLTSYRKGLFPLRRVTPDEARKIVERLQVWQSAYRSCFGRGLVYGADEFYLMAGLPVPLAAYYDDFPQTENGIGITRLFLEDFEVSRRKAPPKLNHPSRVVVATGTLAAPLLERLVQQFTAGLIGLEARVVPVTNLLFGPEVTVTGLLAGRDLLAGLKEAADWAREKRGIVLIPDIMLKSDTPLFLDDLPLDRLALKLGLSVEVVPTTGEGLVQGLIKAGGS